nr:MAG TPA: hypothetical protein [Caudoviricetes sp.]
MLFFYVTPYSSVQEKLLVTSVWPEVPPGSLWYAA